MTFDSENINWEDLRHFRLTPASRVIYREFIQATDSRRQKFSCSTLQNGPDRCNEFTNFNFSS